MERVATIVLASVLFLVPTDPLQAQTLKGSKQAMQRQNRVAQQHEYTFLQSASQVKRFAEAGYLERLSGDDNYELASVSYPYARPAVRVFVERLAAQYRAACGEKLVVTSLTRPTSEQPGNAHALSVHPAGMAVDLRVSGKMACRSWLERTLMSLERQGVLDAIRENRPPHYHVALFPTQYTQYLARLGAGRSTARLAVADARPGTGARLAVAVQADPENVAAYRVNRGDSLWSIARRHGTTVDELKALNNLRNSRIVAGQVIAVPAAVASGADSP